MTTLLQDIRFGLRMLRKAPGITAAAVVTLALGIGANTTIFSAMRGWMLRPPRIKDAGRVAVILSINPAKGSGYGGSGRGPVSAPDFVAWSEQSHSFEGIAASQWSDFTLTGKDEPERLTGMRVSARYFDVLGVPAALGRTFPADADRPGHDQVVILSDGLWQRRFGSNPGVVGEVIRLDGGTYTVIGVMPSGFQLGVFGPQLWTPLVFAPESLIPAAREERNLHVLARLKSEVSVETAEAEMAVLARRSEQTHPGTGKGWSATAMTLQDYLAAEFRVAMRLLMGMVVFVLLIACANIASLQLSRAAERQREFAVRAALGAGRFRLIRQLLIESLLIALAGGGLGLLLASWGVDLFRSGLSWNDYVRSMALEVTIDPGVLAFTVAISVIAAILFGLAPALHQATLNLNSALKEGGRTSSDGKARNRTRSVLVVAQISLALALLVGAGMHLQTFLLNHVSRGFGIDPNRVLTAEISLTSSRYRDASSQAAFFRNAIQRLEELPDVISAGATTSLSPSVEGSRVVTFSVEGRAELPRTERPRTDYFAISPDYPRALRLPLVRGRRFLPSDDAKAPRVALVSQTFAQRYFPNEQPIGKRLRLDTSVSGRPQWSEIVGVVGAVNDPFSTSAQVYEPHLQSPSSAMTLVVRTRSDPAAFAPMLRRAVWSLDENQPITRVQTMNQVIANYGAGGIMMSTMVGAFAGLALALAMMGVFGVTAYTVAQRTHEIGIHMALGARKREVLRMAVRRGMILGAIGIGIGGVMAAPLIWVRMIPEEKVMSLDQRVFVFFAAVFLLSVAALLASYLPARRATKVEPMAALRYE